MNTSTLQEATQFLEDYLANKMDSGELRRADLALTAEVMMNCVSGFVLRRQLLHDPQALQYSQEQIIDSILSITLYGLLPG
jgi:hypothetical protein